MQDLKPVLLAEDEPFDVFLMQKAFRLDNIPNPLLALPDGQETIWYLQGRGHYANRRQYPLPCLLVLDLKLPLLGGFDVLCWIQQQPALKDSLPVIVLSSSDQEADVRKAVALGARQYLVKPVSFAELLAMVNDLKHAWLEPLHQQHEEPSPPLT